MRRGVTLAAIGALLALWAVATPAAASAPWWEPAGFAGQTVVAVGVDTVGVHVRVAGVGLVAAEPGAPWQPGGPAEAHAATNGDWRVRGGVPAQVVDGEFSPDPAGPLLGGGGLITAPAALPGAVVAVDADSVVWRRDQTGAWARALLLLPDRPGVAAPRVTALTSFEDSEQSTAVYLGTDDFGVLESVNGGDDWIRADAGLPAGVTAMATDSLHHDVYAATTDGLFVHHLAELPAPPAYADAAYWWRVAGMALVVVLAAAAAVAAMRRGFTEAAPAG